VNSNWRARELESNSGVRARLLLARPLALCGAVLLLASCRSFGPPPSELGTLLPVASPALAGPLGQHELRVSIESEALSGEFEGVAATRSLPEAGARLQLFGDLGGKLFDMAAQADRFVGYFPHAEVGVEFKPEGEDLPRHLISFMAASLLEASSPITLERVRAARQLEDSGWELELEPVMAGVEVTAVLTAKGDLVERRYRMRGLRWSEEIGAERIFRGGDFQLTLTSERTTALDALPDGVFELMLPEGFHP